MTAFPFNLIRDFNFSLCYAILLITYWQVCAYQFSFTLIFLYLAGGAFIFRRTFRFHTMNATYTPIEDVTQLSPLVCRVLGQNPSPFTLLGTNTYLVGSGKNKILIDAGEPNIAKYIENLKSALGNDKISCIIATHWHGDHVGGIPQVLQICGDQYIPVYKFQRSGKQEDKTPELYQYVGDGHELSVEGASLKVIHTPGHTNDHVSIYLKEENSLFSGDCILGEGSTVFEDLQDYMKSLNLLKNFNVQKIYPGHGPVIEAPAEKIEEYIAHRIKRENQILDYLRTVDSASAMTITSAVYKVKSSYEYMKLDIPLGVKLAAVSNVKHHLTKLIKDKRVEQSNFGFYRLLTSN